MRQLQEYKTLHTLKWRYRMESRLCIENGPLPKLLSVLIVPVIKIEQNNTDYMKTIYIFNILYNILEQIFSYLDITSSYSMSCSSFIPMNATISIE